MRSPKEALIKFEYTKKTKFTPAEIAELTGGSTYTVLHLIQRGNIVAETVLVGREARRHRVLRTEVRKYLERRVR